MPDSEEQAEKNQRIVDSLRDAFDPLTARLTPDVEPATIYPVLRISDPRQEPPSQHK